MDQDITYPKETEYRSICSIFAPLEDALRVANLPPGEVDFCLLAGGSSLLPQVQDALRRYFCRSELLTFSQRERVQLAVARGAAWHALSLAAFGRPLVEFRAHATLALRAEQRLFPLVSRGMALPFPPEGKRRFEGLQVPRTCLQGSLPLRVEVVRQDGGEESLVFASIWHAPAPVTKGTPLVLDFRLDENQVLDFCLGLAYNEAVQFQQERENPLTHVINPGKTRLAMEELEESIRSGNVADAQLPKAMEKLAGYYQELGQRERAFSLLKRLLAQKGRPDATILNRLAILAGEMGNVALEEKFYREAIAAEPSWDAPLFNLALALFRTDATPRRRS